MSGFAESPGTGKQICIPMIPEQVCNDLCFIDIVHIISAKLFKVFNADGEHFSFGTHGVTSFIVL